MSSTDISHGNEVWGFAYIRCFSGMPLASDNLVFRWAGLGSFREEGLLCRLKGANCVGTPASVAVKSRGLDLQGE